MKRIFAAFAAVLVVFSMAAGPAMAAPSDDLDFDDDKTPDPLIEWDTVEVESHNNSAMDSSVSYYDDSGNVQELNASLNSSLNESVGVEFDKIDADAYGTFPRVDGENTSLSVSAVDDSGDWTKDVSGSAGSATITDDDGSTAAGVEAVEFSTSSQTSGDVAKFTYNNFTALDDGEKRVPFVGASFENLPAGTLVQFRFEDSDGDYVAANASTTTNASAAEGVTDGANSGVVWQEKIQNLPVKGSGDGQMSELSSVTVTIEDGDGTVTLYALDAARKSAVDLGDTWDAADGESDTIQETSTGGVIGLTNASTMPSMFSDATIHDYEVYGVQFRLSDLMDEDDYSVEFSSADNYAFPRKVEIYGRLTPKSAIDLTYSGGSLQTEQGFISDRYKVAEVAEGISDTDFENVSSWSDVTSSYDGVNETQTLDDTVQVGQSYGIHTVIVLQNDDESEIKAKSVGAGGGGGFWSGGNPIGSFINGIIAGGVAIMASLGLIAKRGS